MGDFGSISVLERSSEEVKGYLLQYSGLKNSMDCIVHGVTERQTQLSDFYFTSFLRLGMEWRECKNYGTILENSLAGSIQVARMHIL